MKQRQKSITDFYQNLGKLFFAIAASDKVIRPEEYETLKELITRYWLPLKFNYATANLDIEHLILNAFECLSSDNEYDTEKYFKDFIFFKRHNENLFSAEIKTLILKTAGKIASSFSRQNKSELILLAKLSLEFK